ncbi:MAG: ABA4-like family protein [Pseudomonadota bacterium]|nr:ABA4-like family protein [Pseudomonadota bacterium]
MTWDFLFGFTNSIALAGWLALALLPRGPKVMALVLYAGVAILCLIYAVLFVLLFGKLIDPGQVAGATGQGSFTSIEGIRRLFMTDGGIVVGWTHYLAFDLFVGLWIAKDADHKGFARLTQIPFLLATLIAGPIGLFLWLIIRERRARLAARAAK